MDLVASTFNQVGGQNIEECPARPEFFRLDEESKYIIIRTNLTSDASRFAGAHFYIPSAFLPSTGGP